MNGTVFIDLNRVGVVIRNDVREFLGAFCALEEGGTDAEEAEALAALHALEFVADVCPFNMVLKEILLWLSVLFDPVTMICLKLGISLNWLELRLVYFLLWLFSM
jgi:hypothetical protein